jgi:hypothetical protein
LTFTVKAHSRRQRRDLEESLDPFPVTLHQRLVDEGAGRQRLAFEAALEVGDKGPQRDIGRKQRDGRLADDGLAIVEAAGGVPRRAARGDLGGAA